MSGQDYVYIVWGPVAPLKWADEIISTFPTKYQAQYFIDRQTEGEYYRIQRWRHGDREGHWCD